MRICAACYSPVRYSKTAKTWFHKTGHPDTELPAYETTTQKPIHKRLKMKSITPDTSLIPGNLL